MATMILPGPESKVDKVCRDRVPRKGSLVINFILGLSLSVLSALASTTQAAAGDVTLSHREPGLSGDGWSGDYYLVQGRGKMIKALHFEGPITQLNLAVIHTLLRAGRSYALSLNSRGGQLRPAMRLGRLIRKRRLPVFVPDGAECSSACVSVLAAGSSRVVSRTARVGVHRGRTETGADGGRELTLLTLRPYLREMLPVWQADYLVELMAVTPAAEIRYLTPFELLSGGLQHYPFDSGAGQPPKDSN